MIRIGIDLGGTKIEGIALDAAGGVLWRERVPAPQSAYAQTLDAIAALVRRIESGLGEGGSVGVGTPGAASPVSGRMRNCNSTWLNGERLREDLCERLGREVRIANDADCFTLSEATDGAAAGAATVFGVILGTGVGGGICVGGRLLAGPNAIAGEWGHNLFGGPRGGLAAGRACYCGRSDCVETWLSGAGLLRTYREIGGGCPHECGPTESDPRNQPRRLAQPIGSQTTRNSIIAMNTPADPRSLAWPESGWMSVLTRSTSRSIAELNISAISTRPQAPSSSDSSTALRAIRKASGTSGTSSAHCRRKAVSLAHAVRRPFIENTKASATCITPRRPCLCILASMAAYPAVAVSRPERRILPPGVPV